jgi:hypothetical protein
MEPSHKSRTRSKNLEAVDAAYKRSFVHKLRIRPDFYNATGAHPHHDLAA